MWSELVVSVERPSRRENVGVKVRGGVCQWLDICEQKASFPVYLSTTNAVSAQSSPAPILVSTTLIFYQRHMDSLSNLTFIDLQAMLKYALEQKDIADAAGHSAIGIDWTAKVDKLRQAIADKFAAI